ncbi:MAG: guanylate kinase [Parvibaculales bacterium]
MTSPTHIIRRGLMLVLSSPSGAGKTSLSRSLLASDDNLTLSISITTRPPRASEKQGHDYHFVDAQDFGELQNRGDLLESAKVFEHYYGTPRQPVIDALTNGRDVLFDIDWQGTQQLQAEAADDLVKVFVLPPSVAELERRLHNRAQDSAQVVARRMAEAGAEISHYPEYDYIIINHDADESLAQLKSILTAERLRRARQTGLSDFVKLLRSSL